jgi:hypothetical protein
MTNGNIGPSYQLGVSKLGLVLLIAFTASILTMGLKVGPFYLDNSVLIGVAEELVVDGTASDLTLDEIRQRFATALRLNGIYGFDLGDIQVSRSNGGRTAIHIAYERRVPMFANLDVIAAFDHTSQ